jgi:hypothetical protein
MFETRQGTGRADRLVKTVEAGKQDWPDRPTRPNIHSKSIYIKAQRRDRRQGSRRRVEDGFIQQVLLSP